MQSKGSFFTPQENHKDGQEAILFDPVKLKAFVKNTRRTSSSAERIASKSDSNSEREDNARTTHALNKSK